MNNKSLVSVIVPVYKVEQYLPRCLDSIINQTYQNLEIILIDDGSPDDSGKICDSYACKDNRIKVFHTENGGQAKARNHGLKIALGDFIAFVDSDDWCEPDMIETLVDRAVVTGAEICMAGFFREEPQGSVIISCKETTYYSTNEAQKALLYGEIDNTVWNKIYIRSIFEEERFPEGKYFEDLASIHHFLSHANVVDVIKKPVYHYFQREASTIHSYNAPFIMGYADAYLDRYYFLCRTYPDVFKKDDPKVSELAATGISRVWRWWFKCNRAEKKKYRNKIKKLKAFSVNNYSLFGYRSWPLQLRVTTFFMHSDNIVSFATVYFVNWIVKKTKNEKLFS